MLIKIRKNLRTIFILRRVIFVLIVLCLCVWFLIGDKVVVLAATAPYNDEDSTNGVRIDGWRELQQMTTFGHNNDNGCGFTAMAILLQYYNDYTMSSGDILPANFDYKLDTGTLGNNTRANALREDLKNRTPRLLGGLGQQIEQWFTSLPVGNATAAVNHADGLNSFFHANNLNIKASHFDWHNSDNYGVLRAMKQIDENRPVIMTLLNYKYTGDSSDSGTLFGGDAHVVVVYGYRHINNEIQFLAHSGWDSVKTPGSTELWFSPNGIFDPFIYGITYIDAPVTPRYNTTPIENNNIQINSVNGNLSGHVLIPEKINGMIVTQLGNSAFAGKTGITKITFTSGSQLKTIGSSTFKGCTSLGNISIPSSVTNIDSSAFENCTGLKSVTLSNKLTSIGSLAFKGCTSLGNILIPNSVTNIDSSAFENCTGLTRVTLSNKLTSIGSSVFKGCTSLSNITIPYGITQIKWNAFENCTSLTNVNLPSTLAIIVDSAFKGCSSLSSIIIPDNVTFLDSNVFENCTSLTNVTLPNNLSRIGDSAFKGCTSLCSITIPNSITDIGSNAFENCSNLESVTIQRDKDDITNLGSDVFTGCNLKTIKVPTNRTLEYMQATNWSSYSNLIIIDSYPFWLHLYSAGGNTNDYKFEIIEDNNYQFYHNCVNPVEMKITDGDGKVLLYNPSWYSYPIFINLEKGKTYKISLITTNDEDFNINIDKIDKSDEKELEIEKKYYETLNRHSFAYYSFETTDETKYTINSTIAGARSNMWLYDTSGNLITYDYGDDKHNGAKITTNLVPSTTYIVILYLESWYSSDDYTIQFYKTSQEVYHLDWASLPKQYFDPMRYDYVNFFVFSRCYDLVFEEETKTIKFGRIECFWDVTYSGYPDNPQEYVIGMMIGISYDSFEKTLPFFSFNGFYEERAALPYTYSYSATVTGERITLSDSDWANYVSVGPR